jgi:hypothetical protein
MAKRLGNIPPIPPPKPNIGVFSENPIPPPKPNIGVFSENPIPPPKPNPQGIGVGIPPPKPNPQGRSTGIPNPKPNGDIETDSIQLTKTKGIEVTSIPELPPVQYSRDTLKGLGSSLFSHITGLGISVFTQEYWEKFGAQDTTSQVLHAVDFIQGIIQDVRRGDSSRITGVPARLKKLLPGESEIKDPSQAVTFSGTKDAETQDLEEPKKQSYNQSRIEEIYTYYLRDKIYITLFSSPGNIRVTFPLMLEDLKYVPDSSFPSLNILRRNIQKFHFAGSEDTLEFKIRWDSGLTYPGNAESILTKAMKIASLCKTHNGQVPLIKFSVGDNDSHGLTFFNPSFEYVLTKAPMEIVQIGLRQKEKEDMSPSPRKINQTLSFNRVSQVNLDGSTIYFNGEN